MIEILSSGVSLGHFVPALRMRDRLRQCGMDACVLVFENLLSEEVRTRIDKTMGVYHSSFAFARTAQRLATQLVPVPVQDLSAALVERWVKDPPHRIIALSGYWMPLLEQFAARRPDKRDIVELLHIDTCHSPVWRASAAAAFQHRWLASAEAERVFSYLPVSGADARQNRSSRVVVHGGGWGIGDYREVVAELLDRAIGVDLVAYAEDEVGEADPSGRLRFLMISTWWRPWHLQDDEPTYPPLAEASGRVVPDRTTPALDHEILHYISDAAAIVSKPGGATLVDSFSTGTPIVFLTPYGEHESTNASLWRKLGYGMTINDWRSAKLSLEVLEPLRLNLDRARRETPVFPDGVYGPL